MKNFMVFLTAALVTCFANTTFAANTSPEGDSLKFASLGTFGNDSIIPFRADQHDEYNTYSGMTSLFWGTRWGVIEVGHGSQMYAPAAVFQAKGKLKDRLWAGAMTYQLALHNQWPSGIQTRFALGVDVIGPQTGLGYIQTRLHELLDLRTPCKCVLRNQIGNATYFAAQAEVAYPIEFGMVTMRPFGEVRVGYEQLARVGVDVFFGGAPSVLTREYVTGQVFTPRAPRGWSANIGIDYTHVFQSALYPERSPVDMIADFGRIRAAVVYQGRRWNVQLGVASISPQFVGQKRGWQEVAYIAAGISW